MNRDLKRRTRRRYGLVIGICYARPGCRPYFCFGSPPRLRRNRPRGRNGAGRSAILNRQRRGLASNWPATGPRRLWRRDLGEGYSAISAEGGKLFTMYRKDEQEVAIALDSATGKTLWEYAYDAPFWKEDRTCRTGRGRTPRRWSRALTFSPPA